MQILSSEQYPEYEAFVQRHPMGFFTQSTRWMQVKREWGGDVIVSRDDSGAIKGGLLVLRRSTPFGALLYAPRGPVCDCTDEATLRDLLAGVRELARRHRAFECKMDPIIEECDERAIATLTNLGFAFEPGRRYGRTAQPRSQFVLDLHGVSEDDILRGMSQKTRYNIRVAQKHGVTCRSVGRDAQALEAFYPIYAQTAKRGGFTIRTREYYQRQLDAYGEHAEVFACEHEGRVLAAALVVCYAGRWQYVHGASCDDARNLMPTYLLQWTMIREALARGCRLYDFMGTPAAEDVDNKMYGLYRFKKGFGGRSVTYAGEFDLVLAPMRRKLFYLAQDARIRYLTMKNRRREKRHG